MSMSSAAVSPTAPKLAATVSKILDAAAELFVARNYADVTVDQVAEAAHLTKGAVYHHFASKEQLYLAMMHRDLEAKRAENSRVAAGPGSARERLRALTALFFARAPVERSLIRLVRRDANIFGEPARSELVRAYQEALPDPIESILRDGIRDDEIIPADPRLLAWQFIAQFEVLLTPYGDQRFGCDDDKVNYAVSIFFNGVRSRVHEEIER